MTIKKPAAKPKSKPKPSADETIVRLTGELSAAQEALRIEIDLATVRMKRIESLQVDLAATVAQLRKMGNAHEERTQQLDVAMKHNTRLELDLKAQHEALQIEMRSNESSRLRLLADLAASDQALLELAAAKGESRRVAMLEAFIRKSLHEGQINCTEATELLRNE